MGCPSENTLLDLVEGRLDDDAKRETVRHLEACPSCQDLAGEAARAVTPGAPEAPVALERGSAVARYLVLDRVGAGAMGIVHAAYDPELGRKIALKLLHPDPARADALGARLRREAQALARLNHPNVIAVHDVGAWGDQVFLAMEFVEGTTLAGWLRAARRSPSEVLSVFRSAGQGLAAAHAAGLVHRDFKPENVLVGGDGRVKVTDFGLARGSDQAEVEDGGAPAGADGGGLGATLTRTGALVGTPAYMAPEQLAGKAADARSDLYAFCVALYEALYGERPFAAADLTGLARAREAQAVRDPPRGSRVPAWLRRVLLRGLRPRPHERFPDVPALLDALDEGPRRRRRQRAIAAFAALAAALAGLVVVRAGREPPCAGAAHAWGSTWDAAEAGRAREAFARSGKPSADRSFAAASEALSDYRAAWQAMRTDACEATRLRGEQSEAMLDRRMACLDERRREAAALGRIFAEADGAVVDGALSAASSLGSLDACANLKALAEPFALPASPEARRRLDALATTLAEVKARSAADQYADALRLAVPAAEEARTLGFPPLYAKLLVARGWAEEDALRFDAAEASYHEAARLSQEARDDGTLADAWTRLVGLVGYRRKRPEEAREWARYAEAAIRRLGGDEPREMALIHRRAIVLWFTEVELDEASALLERGRAIAARRGAALLAARFDGIAGGVLLDRGDPEASLAVQRRALSTLEALHGPGHPATEEAIGNVAEALAMVGRPAEAIPMLRGVVARGQHQDPSYVRHRLADALRRAGDAAAALAEDRASVAASAEASRGDPESVPPALAGVGLDLLLLGRPAEAIAPLERVVLHPARPGFEPGTAEPKLALARALWDGGGDRARARRLAEEARAGYARAAERWGSARYRRVAVEAASWLAAHPAP